MMRYKYVEKRPNKGLWRRIVEKSYTLLNIHHSTWFQALAGNWGSTDYVNLKAETFSNAYAARCFELITQSLASINIRAEVESEEGGKKTTTVVEHEFLKVLERPNRGQTRSQFLSRIIEDLWFGGELFFYMPESPLTGTGAGRPGKAGLYLIRPDKVKIIEYEKDDEGFDTDIPVSYTWHTRNGKIRETVASRIVHVVFIEHPTIYNRGWPLVMAIWRAIVLMKGGDDWNLSIVQKKGRIPGFFKFTGRGRLGDFEKMKREFQEAYARDTELAQPGMMERDFTFEAASTTVKDADWTESERMALRKIGAGLGVDAALLNDPGNRTVSNMREAMKALVTRILPVLDWILEQMNAHFMPMYENEAKLTYDENRVAALQETLKEKTERWAVSIRGMMAIPDEARKDVGLPTFDTPASTRLYAPGNVVPLDQVGAQSEPTEEDLLKYVRELYAERHIN